MSEIDLTHQTEFKYLWDFWVEDWSQDLWGLLTALAQPYTVNDLAKYLISLAFILLSL